jgi:signal transduction histidine kinase
VQTERPDDRQEPRSPASEIEPGRRGLLFGILVYRVAAFALMVALAFVVDLRSTTLTAALLVAIGAWIAVVSVLRAWDRTWALGTDLAISAALLLAAPFLAAEGALVREPYFAGAYPLATVMSWAAVLGLTGGLVASVVLAVPLACSRALNGTSFVDLDSGDLLSVGVGTIYYVLGGLLVGLFTRTMDRASRRVREASEEAARERERAARLREREQLARSIHDSVLQALAVVHRRGQEMAARQHVDGTEVGELVALVDGQERHLRSLLGASSEEPPEGTVPLRTVLEAGAFGIAGMELSVSTVEPAWLEATAAAEVSAAVRAALDNVVRHASARHVTVFGEAEAGEVVVSIRDDGVGFRVDDEIGPNGTRGDRFGIAHSIRGRIEDLGGAVRIESEPGRGTQVELRLPMPPEAATEGERP